jgi:hypothetical protein
LQLSDLERTLSELIEYQQARVLACARRFSPSVIPDDLLQPNDFPLLEHNPEFRYEEGVLAGLRSALAALRGVSKSSLTF